MASSEDRTTLPRGATSRRRVLQGLGATGTALIGLVAASARVAAAGLPTLLRPGRRVVFRLTTRGRSACRACRIHHRYVVGSEQGLLNARRAHPGCNCPIVSQLVSVPQFRAWFPSGRGVVDLRDFGAGGG